MDKSDVEVWMPSDNDEQRIDVGEAATMGVEIKIEKPRTVVERLKNTAFGQFYSKHLKKKDTYTGLYYGSGKMAIQSTQTFGLV